MPPQDSANQHTVFSELIKQHITIFGMDITVEQLKQIKGMDIDQEGTVTAILEKPEILAQELLKTWQELSPFLSKKIAEPKLSPFMSTGE